MMTLMTEDIQFPDAELDEIIESVVTQVKTHLKKWVHLLEFDTYLRLSFCHSPGKHRQTKREAERMLNNLLRSVDAMRRYDVAPYAFDFEHRTYYRGEHELYLTAGEQLAVYQFLTKQKGPRTAQFMYNIRSKYGKTFLNENT